MAIYFLAVMIASYLHELQRMQIQRRSRGFYHESDALGLRSLHGIFQFLVRISSSCIIYQTILFRSFDTDDAQVVEQVETADVFCIRSIILIKNILRILEVGNGNQRT